MTSCPCSLAPRDHPDLVSPPSSLRISLASSPLKASPESTKYWMSQQFKLMSPGSVAVCRPTQNHKPFHTQVWLRAWWVCSCAEPGHRGHEGESEARKSRTLDWLSGVYWATEGLARMWKSLAAPDWMVVLKHILDYLEGFPRLVHNNL